MNPLIIGPLFTVLNETVKSFPTFLPSLPKARHIQPGTTDADDVRLGYVLAIGWSLCVAVAVHNGSKSTDVYLLWAVVALIMIGLYEIAIRDTGQDHT